MLREAALPGIPLYIFLIAYFGTTLLGNILYSTSFGAELPSFNVDNYSLEEFRKPFKFQFWLLLLLPFLLCPVAIFVARITSPLAATVAPWIPEIPKSFYLVLSGLLYIYAIRALFDASAFSRFMADGQATDAVENRFALLAAIGFLPQVALKSLLVFLSIYGTVRAARDNGWFWSAVTCANVTLLTACLILLNMKWPAVVFILTLGVCVFIVSRSHPYTKAIIVTVMGMTLYLTLSVAILRWFPPLDDDSLYSTRGPRIERDTSIGLENIFRGSLAFAPKLMIGAVNRMAIAVPFYYDFSDFSGPTCQPALSRLWIKRPLSCEPTLLVYSTLFKDDGFAGRGTAPAAANIYGYALAGWPGAIISTLIAMTVIGLFLALWSPAQTNAVFAAAYIMGAYTGYFFSQLPIEGPIAYDHGMLWWALLVLAWSIVSLILKRALSGFTEVATERAK